METAVTMRAAGLKAVLVAVFLLAAWVLLVAMPGVAHAAVNVVAGQGSISDGYTFDEGAGVLTVHDGASFTEWESGPALAVEGDPGETLVVKLEGSSSFSGGEHAPAILSNVNLNITGAGSMTLASSGNGITLTDEASLAFEASKLTVNVSRTAVSVAGNIDIASGTLSTSGADGIVAGGALNIGKAAKVNVSTADSRGKALAAGSGYAVSNDPASLGTIAGTLGLGAKFNNSTARYQVLSDGVRLIKYTGSKASVTVSNTVFGKASYAVREIGALAFAKNKKLKKLTLSVFVRKIGAKAFYKTTQLKVLDIRNVHKSLVNKAKGKAQGVAAAAFKKCGKGGGKKLTVRCGSKSAKVQKKLRKTLVKKGLSKKAKVVF